MRLLKKIGAVTMAFLLVLGCMPALAGAEAAFTEETAEYRDEIISFRYPADWSCGVAYDGIYQKLATAARGYRLDQLAAIVSLCAEYDYRMKRTGLDPDSLIRELFARIAAEGRT